MGIIKTSGSDLSVGQSCNTKAHQRLTPVPLKPVPAAVPAVKKVYTSYLETLLGYNAPRTWLRVIELFSTRVAVYDLRPVNFSVLSLITHNPGITSRQLCSALSLLPPNLVGVIGAMKKANWSLGGHTRKTAAPSACI